MLLTIGPGFSAFFAYINWLFIDSERGRLLEYSISVRAISRRCTSTQVLINSVQLCRHWVSCHQPPTPARQLLCMTAAAAGIMVATVMAIVLSAASPTWHRLEPLVSVPAQVVVTPSTESGPNQSILAVHLSMHSKPWLARAPWWCVVGLRLRPTVWRTDVNCSECWYWRFDVNRSSRTYRGFMSATEKLLWLHSLSAHCTQSPIWILNIFRWCRLLR